MRALVYSAAMFVARDVLSGRLGIGFFRSSARALLETPDGDGHGDLLRAALRDVLLPYKVSLDTALIEKHHVTVRAARHGDLRFRMPTSVPRRFA